MCKSPALTRESRLYTIFNHVIDLDLAKVIDKESNRMDQWIREAIHVRKEQVKSINREEGTYQLPHIYDYLLSAAATPGGQSF